MHGSGHPRGQGLCEEMIRHCGEFPFPLPGWITRKRGVGREDGGGGGGRRSRRGLLEEYWKNVCEKKGRYE